MPRQSGKNLFFARKYKEAAMAFSLEAEADRTDDFRIGPILDANAALICGGQYQASVQNLEGIIQSTPYSVSSHCIYLGAARWYEGNAKAAIEIWLGAADCDYHEYSGLDIPYILYFASLHRPDLSDQELSLQRIANKTKTVNEGGLVSLISGYLLNEYNAEHFHKAILDIRGRNIANRRRDRLLLFEFYSALKCGLRPEAERYYAHMKACAEGRFSSISFEWAISHCESRSHIDKESP